MGYPGDQGQYGGWGSEQPPPSQYAPGQGTTPSPYAPGQDAAHAQYAPGQGPPPYAPGQGAPPAPNGQDPFGRPPAHDPFGRPPAQDSYAEYGAYDRPAESLGYGDDLDSGRSRMPLIIGCVAGAGVLIVAGVVVALSGGSSSTLVRTKRDRVATLTGDRPLLGDHLGRQALVYEGVAVASSDPR